MITIYRIKKLDNGVDIEYLIDRYDDSEQILASIITDRYRPISSASLKDGILIYNKEAVLQMRFELTETIINANGSKTNIGKHTIKSKLL